jgi:hypothetical protein
MLCPKCGSELADTYSLCPKCGCQLPVSPSPLITSAVPHITSFSITSPPKSPSSLASGAPAVKKSSRRWPFVVLLILILVIVGVYFSQKLQAFNPLEPSRHAKDTAMEKNINNLLSALNTYYAANYHYPWTGDANGYSSLNIASEPWVVSLTAFPKNLSSKIILIQEADSSQTLHLCYLPQSQANQKIAKDKCFSGYFYQQYAASICASGHDYLCFP